jgi:hypothetical protein
MKLGTQTGSLINHVFSTLGAPKPAEGMGATILKWTDREACTITKVVSDKRIEVRPDKATLVDGKMSDQQEYTYTPGDGPRIVFTLRKNGAWVRLGDSMRGGNYLMIGRRDHYYDYSF